MTSRLHLIVMEPEQTIHLGVGRGSGFSSESHQYVPGSTLRGALSAAWWRTHPKAKQADFDDLIATVTCSDAVVSSDASRWSTRVAALDRKVCKLCRPNDPGVPPDGFPWATKTCPACDGPMEPSKGKRALPPGAQVLSATRVQLNRQEQAEDEKLYERQGLHAGGSTLVAMAAGRADELAPKNQALRVGAATSVAGRLRIADVVPYSPPTLTIPAGSTRLRVELLTPGVYVDEFGCAVNQPSAYDLRWSFGLPENANVVVERAFARWTTSSGWHSMANRPKPEDSAVIAHSCFYVCVDTADPMTVPTVVHDLGVRTGEGCGWAELSLLQEDADLRGDTDA